MSSSVGMSDSTHDSLAAVTCSRHMGQCRLWPLLEGEEEEELKSRLSWRLRCVDFCLAVRNGDDWAASPFVDALLTEAVSARQDEVGLAVHADAALLLVSQLLDPAQQTANQRTAGMEPEK